MRGSLRLLFLVVISCIGVGCAHTSGPMEATPQQQSQVAPSVAGGVPSMQVPETSYDFGKVKDTDGEMIHEFKIKNVGTAALQIKKVLPG